METVQLQCGNCNQLMAIAAEHMGGQVQCPHCQAVVQTPELQPAAASDPGGPRSEPPAHVIERESIFAGPEASDDLFGSSDAPRVDYPAPEQREPDDAHAFADHAGVATEPAPGEAPQSELPKPPRPRPIYDRSMGPLIALIFLVPYAILSTIFVAYLLMQLWNVPAPLEILPDPQPKSGARKVRVAHDSKLVAKLKTSVGTPLRVGDLEVVPQKIWRNGDGDLEMQMKVKNVSKNAVFAPIHDSFLHVQDVQGGKPYTYLQSPYNVPLYGGYAKMLKDENGHKRSAGEGELAPGEEELLVLTTTANHDERKVLDRILKGNETLVWRVQLRRGLVYSQGKWVSATAVVGVQFSPKDVSNEA